MQIDFTLDELTLISSILEDYKNRINKFSCFSPSEFSLFGNTLNKVDNALSI